MIQAKELRIGNYLREISPSENKITKVKIYHFEGAENGEVDLFPIPLTEQWLIDFGFERGEDILGVCYYIESNSQVKDFAVHLDNDILSDLMNDIQLTHVHQLQNLYFALTGKELTKQNNPL